MARTQISSVWDPPTPIETPPDRDPQPTWDPPDHDPHPRREPPFQDPSRSGCWREMGGYWGVMGGTGVQWGGTGVQWGVLGAAGGVGGAMDDSGLLQAHGADRGGPWGAGCCGEQTRVLRGQLRGVLGALRSLGRGRGRWGVLCDSPP